MAASAPSFQPLACPRPPTLGERTKSTSSSYVSAGRQAEQFYFERGYLPAINPPNEAERKRALARYGPPRLAGDPNFDRIGHLVRLVFNSKIVLVSLVGANEQVFQTAVGGGAELSQAVLQQIAGAKHCSFCAHSILQPNDEPLVILDTEKDWRFMGNPLVVGEPHIRFYAGCPLRTTDGLNLGTLCLIDPEPRSEFSPRLRHTLKEFGRVVMRELELTRDRIHLTIRDRMQKSIEFFTRDCLEMATDASHEDEAGEGGDGKNFSSLHALYNTAARNMQTTLKAAGAIVFDLSHFELIESPSSNGQPSKDSKIFYPNEQPSGDRNAPVPLSHHIKVAQFLRQHRTGCFYANVPTVFRHLLPHGTSSMLLVPIFGLNKQPFALLCAYVKQAADDFEDVRESALQYMRSMGTIILSAVLKKDLMLADQAKSHFISNISHELRTPLHGILASAELLAETKLNTTQGSYLDTVEACGKSLLELVNHVLDFTKLSGGARSKSNAEHKLTQCDLVKLVQEVCESSWIGQTARKLESQQTSGIGSAYAIGASGTAATTTNSAVKKMKAGAVETVIDVSMRSKGWLVTCDAGGIRRVLMNLIGNSLKFTTAGFVHVSLREVQSSDTHIVVELSVTDTGRGISREFLEEQLFHPFTQENQLGPGTGLGLSIVNSIVQSPSINGKIDVWSTLGEGTEMRITCEMAVASPEDIDGAVYQPALSLKKTRSVSLVGFDDSRGQVDLRQVLLSYLDSWWDFAPSKSAVDSGDDYSGDIIIVNEETRFLQEIRKRRTPLPPVILLSSALGDSAVAEACEAYHAKGGIARMLFKPAGPAKLEAVVDFCLQCLDRIDGGEPLEEEQTAPGTPLPSRGPTQRPGARARMTVATRTASQLLLHPSAVGTVTPAKLPSSSSTSSGTSKQPRRRIRVLGVDDNEINIKVLRAFMDKFDVDFSAAFNGQECVELFEQTNSPEAVKRGVVPFDIIICDVTMPVLDGYQATAAIRRKEKAYLQAKDVKTSSGDGGQQTGDGLTSSRVKILCLTGRNSEEDKRRAFASGADGFMTRPLSLRVLSSLMRLLTQ
ncbi:hypothetical protein BDZ90DRAFT_252651 [Jaminaea rosea]|uniref:histidine kinase n=1 Tax=Jaminaea rosea TaxID=1569628 RepID=A0A316URM9_9BASI|nr:hypothetical protein BDZ90DRAFT_252651 [Jaminaea rosea]PWN27428.1 hypothetical protein BDZ90DRAFT_252651 [Jaminaea rosea]